MEQPSYPFFTEVLIYLIKSMFKLYLFFVIKLNFVNEWYWYLKNKKKNKSKKLPRSNILIIHFKSNREPRTSCDFWPVSACHCSGIWTLQCPQTQSPTCWRVGPSPCCRPWPQSSAVSCRPGSHPLRLTPLHYSWGQGWGQCCWTVCTKRLKS